MPAGRIFHSAIALACIVALSALSRTIHISPSGNDSFNDGSGGSPYLTIMKGVNNASSGDTIMVMNGTYTEAISIPGSLSGTVSAPTVMRGESKEGAVVDGEFERGFLFSTQGAEYFHLENMTFRNGKTWFNRGMVQIKHDQFQNVSLLKGWVVRDLVIEKSEAMGLGIGSTYGIVVENCIIQDCFQHGLGGGASGPGLAMTKNVLVRNCIIRRNNPGWDYNPWGGSAFGADSVYHITQDPADNKYYAMGFIAGGLKLSGVDSCIIEACLSYDNHGGGIWFDADNTNIIVRNCTVYGSKSFPHNVYNNFRLGGAGVMFEINTAGPLILEGCHVFGNEAQDIAVSESRNVVVRDNVIEGLIELRCGATRPTIRDLLVENNILQNMQIQMIRMACCWNADSFITNNISFEGNDWQGTVPNVLFGDCAGHCTCDPRQLSGLENLQAEFGSFLTDTWQQEITSAVPSEDSQSAAQSSFITGSAVSGTVFDLRGRIIGRQIEGLARSGPRGPCIVVTNTGAAATQTSMIPHCRTRLPIK